MTSQIQFCGQCFGEFSVEAHCCPHCGADAQVLSYRDYQTKLIHALEHPLADIRMRAIIALGLRGEPSAAPSLVACALKTPTDVVQGIEVVRSLYAMLAGTGERAPLETLAEHHPAHAVTIAAASALAKLPSSPNLTHHEPRRPYP